MERKKYDKSRWLKATFNGATKRFYEPPSDIDLLKEMFQKRFPVLFLLIGNNEKPQETTLGYVKD